MFNPNSPKVQILLESPRPSGKIVIFCLSKASPARGNRALSGGGKILEALHNENIEEYVQRRQDQRQQHRVQPFAFRFLTSRR